MMVDIISHDGRAERPAVILIHGFGMAKEFWREPEQCPVFGGLANLSVFLRTAPPVEENEGRVSLGRVQARQPGLWNLLADAGFSLMAWSQQQPLGPIALAIAELAHVVEQAGQKWPDRPLYLVGHSRGGLVARGFLLDRPQAAVVGLVTMGTPHQGTALAELSAVLQPLGLCLERLLPRETRSTRSAAMKRFAALVTSEATTELSPGSDFMRALARPLPGDIRKLSFAGTDPALFKFYMRPCAKASWKTFSYSELLARVIPAKRLPVEIEPGKGDGLVAVASARLPGAVHVEVAAHHVGLAFEGSVQRTVKEFLAE